MGTEPVQGEQVGAYQVVHHLARGGMATVYEVVDTRTGSRCALKLLQAAQAEPEARSRFRREFRALSRLHHPNVLEVFEWGLRGDRPWYSMELLEGNTLKAEVAPWAGLEPEDRFARAKSILVQVARALTAIHERGLVHRDITPSNIMVLRDGRVKLMDFGVVKDLDTELTVAGDVVGTVAYIAPEQVRGGPIDARADLYALGAVLYLMLTGQRPFQARTLQGYLDRHLNQEPRPPREVQPLVPPLLDEVCNRLLRKDPAERYASASHLLHVLGDRLESAIADARWTTPLVGRTLERAWIRDALESLVSRRQGAALLIEGAPGAGKTALVDLAEAYGRRLGLTVARGRCRPHDRPFGAFVGVFDELAGDAPPPVLLATLRGDDDGVIRERYPVIAALKELVVQRAPCVVLLDDLDNADPATLETLDYLVRNTLELAQEPVVFVLGAERASDATSSVQRLLRDDGCVRARYLGPLGANEVEELVVAMVGPGRGPKQLAARLHEESNGSPAFIADMVRGLIDEGAIATQGDRYRLTLEEAEITRSRLPMPASLRQALKDRVAPLSPQALEVGRTLAIARRRMVLDALIDVADLDEDDVIDALDELSDAGIVAEARLDDVEQVELSHKRFRDVLLEPLDADDQRRRHRRMGEALERHYRHRLFRVLEDLTYHFEQAGVPPKAYAYLVQAGSRHLSRSLYEESLAFLDRALAMEPEARPFLVLDAADRQRAETLLARSQARFHLGDPARAVQDAHAAATIAENLRAPRLISRVAAEIGIQLRQTGEVDDAERHLRRALDKAAEVGDLSLRPLPLYHLGGLVWGRGDLEQAEVLWREALSTAQRIGDERATGYGYNGLGVLAICKGQSMEARRHLEQSARLFERLGMLAPLSIARMNLAEVYVSAGILRKALALTERTVAQAREVHHQHGIALGLTLRGTVLMHLGRKDEALQNGREALRMVRALGNAEDELVALASLAKLDLIRGRPDRALLRFDELQPLLADHDHEGIAPEVNACRSEALASVGRTEEARALLEGVENARRGWPHVQTRTELAVARAWRILGEHERAARMLQRALAMAESNGFRFHQLQANHELAQVATDEAARSRHARVADALARSLAANLTPTDARSFLRRNWGQIEDHTAPGDHAE